MANPLAMLNSRSIIECRIQRQEGFDGEYSDERGVQARARALGTMCNVNLPKLPAALKPLTFAYFSLPDV